MSGVIFGDFLIKTTQKNRKISEKKKKSPKINAEIPLMGSTI